MPPAPSRGRPGSSPGPHAPRLYLIADHGFLARTSRRPPACATVPDEKSEPAADEPWLQALRRVAPIAAGRPGVALQLRVKDVAAGRRVELLRRGLDIAGAAGVTALINGSFVEAVELQAAGVHWPETLIPERPPAAPPATFRIGASVHSLAAARKAAAAGAGFAVFGPVFAPGSKAARGVGLDALEEVVIAAPLPIVAIGGIAADRVAPCIEAGCAGVAVVSAVFASGVDAARAVDELLAELTHGIA